MVVATIVLLFLLFRWLVPQDDPCSMPPDRRDVPLPMIAPCLLTDRVAKSPEWQAWLRAKTVDRR
jgi:hypothetical protein